MILNFFPRFWNELPGAFAGMVIGLIPASLAGLASIGLKAYRIKKSSRELYAARDDIRDLRYYVPTWGQEKDPCEKEEIRQGIGKDRKKLIGYFLNEVISKDRDGRYFAVLADSGMGKSTFLRKLYLQYNGRLIGRSKQIKYFSLANSKELSFLKAADEMEKNKTVLLLDSLDEDQYAIQNYHARWKEILDVTDGYYKVIISCRTQFFPDQKSEPGETGLIEEHSKRKKREFKKIYLSPFDDSDIRLYLKKRRFSRSVRNKAMDMIKRIPDLAARPLIMGYIDKIMDDCGESTAKISDIYEIIVNEWYHREGFTEEQVNNLKDITEKIAVFMLEHKRLYIEPKELEQFCSQNEVKVLEAITLKSKSLLNRYGNGRYKFAHKSFYEYLIAQAVIFHNAYHNYRKDVLFSIQRLRMQEIFYVELSKKYFRDTKDGEYHYLYLNNMQLADRDFKDARFEGALLEKADFCGSDLSGADFQAACMREARLCNANLEKTVFTKADLSGADLWGANLTQANLAHARLENANFKDAVLVGADLEGVDYSGLNLRLLKKAKGKVEFLDKENFMIEIDKTEDDPLFVGYFNVTDGTLCRDGREPLGQA